MSRSGTPVDPREGIAATDLARVCGWMREKGQTPNPQVVMLLTPEATGRRVGVPVLERVDSPGHEALVRPHICDVCDRPMLWVINTVELAGSVCEHCRVVPGTDIPIPDGYFEYWESAEHPEITRVGSRIAGKSEYVGHGSGRPIQPRKVGMTEAAQLAGISTATLHRMATDGRITATKEPGQGRRFDPAEMRALREAGVGTGDVTRTAADRDYITLGAAAERLGVKDNTVRRRAQATGPDEGPVRYRVVPYGERRTTLLVHREDIDELVSDPAARLDALGDPSSDDDWVNLTDGAALLGMNVATLNRHLDAAGDEALIRSKTVPWGQGKTRMLVHRDDMVVLA